MIINKPLRMFKHFQRNISIKISKVKVKMHCSILQKTVIQKKTSVKKEFDGHFS